MTQSPYGGSASQPMQSTAGPNAAQTTSNNGGRHGSAGASSASASNASNGSNTDFGATTISGSPRQPGAGQQNSGQNSGQQNSSVATEQRTSSSSTASSGGQPLGQSGNFNRPPAAAPTSGRGARNRGPRRARLQLRHINPWTVLKFSAVLAVALFFVWMIMIGVLFGILDGAGIIGKINDAVTTINGPGSKPPITATIVFGGAAIIGVVNIVLFIALSTIGSIVYNLCADLVGGIEITLSER